MSNSNIEILFSLPVKIRQGIEVIEFNNKGDETQFLLISGKRHYVINRYIYNLIKVIRKFSDIEKIRKEFSVLQNTEFLTDEIIIAINEILVQKEIVESKIPVNNPRAKSFLYFRFPIFSRKILKPITACLQYFFTPQIAYLSIPIILVTHALILFNYFGSGQLVEIINNPFILIQTTFIILFSVIFHEFGHSSACRFFGAKYEEIGFGIYLRFPVFYSNITSAWKLSSSKRVVIDIAGIYFQYIFNVFLFILFLFTKQEILLIAIKIVCIQTLFSLNPFFRYDGYWLATDLLGIPNLRKKSRELLKYFFQRYLLKNESKKEIKLYVNPVAKKFFVFYAIVSNLFLMIFVIVLFVNLPSVIKGIPAIIQDTVSVFLNNDNTALEIITTIYQLFIKLLITGLSLFLSIKILSGILKVIKNT